MRCGYARNERTQAPVLEASEPVGVARAHTRAVCVRCLWPQSTLDEVRRGTGARGCRRPRLHVAGRPALVDGAKPWGAEILDRFVRDELGWEEFKTGNGYASAEGLYTELVIIRCAPGQTNPLYPDDPEGRGLCADDQRLPVRDCDARIGTARAPRSFRHLGGDQMGNAAAPRADLPCSTTLPRFHAGGSTSKLPRRPTRKQQRLWRRSSRPESLAKAPSSTCSPSQKRSPFDNEEVPLLYGTTGSAPYERYETDRVEWPGVAVRLDEFRTRLFATDETVVEQSFAVIRQEDGHLGLVYGYPTRRTNPRRPRTDSLCPSRTLPRRRSDPRRGAAVEWRRQRPWLG